jgi:molecular chaperone DnaJ
MIQAALGGEVDVPTLDGKGKLKIPAGTQPGSVLRLRGKGIPVRNGMGRGDHLFEIAVEIPKALSSRQRELLELYAKECGEELLPQRKTFRDKLRDLFGS